MNPLDAWRWAKGLTPSGQVWLEKGTTGIGSVLAESSLIIWDGVMEEMIT